MSSRKKYDGCLRVMKVLKIVIFGMQPVTKNIHKVHSLVFGLFEASMDPGVGR